jgi:PPK2 family polyphosphate:nucleotide phosphotransferase
MRLRPVSRHDALALGDRDARPPRGVPGGDELDEALGKQVERLGDLQRVFVADARYALLIVFQGRDASGKDGAIRHVFEAVNPQGCEVSAFKAPTEQELSHDYLWRIHARVPSRGTIGIFNRSHYEDVLVVRVRGLAPKSVWEHRYGQINDFEHMLDRNGVVILKFFLHVSRDEQKKRLRERLSDREKNWKFRAGDLDDRARWADYTRAYRDALRRCSTPWAPWFVIPADDKKVRNWLIAREIVRALEALDLRYPRADPSVLRLRIS